MSVNKIPIDYEYWHLYSKGVVVSRHRVYQDLPMIMTRKNQKKRCFLKEKINPGKYANNQNNKMEIKIYISNIEHLRILRVVGSKIQRRQR